MSLIPSVFQRDHAFVSSSELFSGSTLGASAAVDVVGVYNSAMNQLFPLARPAKAVVTEAAKIAEHPVESGGTISDHRIILPTEIELTLYVTDYRNTYQRIKAAFLSNELLIVQTRTGLYENMAITAIPHEETTGKHDVLDMTFRLKEVKLVRAQFQALPPQQVKKTNDASTVDRGEQKPKSVAAKGSDAVRKGFQKQ
ncbi:MAG: hypothetical protein LBJ76_04065 [Candidatus Accumulibacter sp.]|nr:hypothetical protein [Accumulibacter sp.]